MRDFWSPFFLYWPGTAHGLTDHCQAVVQYLHLGQHVVDVCLYHDLYFGDLGHWPVHFQFHGYPTTGHVHLFVFHGYFYFDERAFYSNREYAAMGTDPNELNPIKYFVQVMRMVMLKGAGLSDIYPQVIKTLAYALIMNGLAVYSYKKIT